MRGDHPGRGDDTGVPKTGDMIESRDEGDRGREAQESAMRRAMIVLADDSTDLRRIS
jgi:hypothetical protein